MANGHGGVRKGAGRPSKIDELRVAEIMRDQMSDEEFWSIVAGKVKEGDTKAMRIWDSRLYGAPKQRMDLKVEDKNLPEWMQNKLDGK